MSFCHELIPRRGVSEEFRGAARDDRIFFLRSREVVETAIREDGRNVRVDDLDHWSHR